MMHVITRSLLTEEEEEEEEISHRQQGPLRGSSSLYGALSQRESLDPIKLAYDQRRTVSYTHLTLPTNREV